MPRARRRQCLLPRARRRSHRRGAWGLSAIPQSRNLRWASHLAGFTAPAKATMGSPVANWAACLVSFLHRQCCKAPDFELGRLFSGPAPPCCNGRPTCLSGLHLRPTLHGSAVCFCSAQTSGAVPLCTPRPAPAEPALIPNRPREATAAWCAFLFLRGGPCGIPCWHTSHNIFHVHTLRSDRVHIQHLRWLSRCKPCMLRTCRSSW